MENILKKYDNTSTTKHAYKEKRFTNKKANNGVLFWLSIMPVIFLKYVQLLFNCAIITFLVLSGIKFIKILETDLDKHLSIQSQKIINNILECSREYFKNNCAVPLPALEKMCDTWSICMQHDTKAMIVSKESTVIVAEILNAFFENLSNRTLTCVATMFLVFILISQIFIRTSRSF